MGVPLPIALATRSSPARQGQEGAARLINCYAEETEDGKNPFAIYASSGLTTLVTVASTGDTRALMPLDAVLLAVMGRVIVAIDPGFASSVVGGLASDGFVTMALNRKAPSPQVAICCDGLFDIYEDGVLTEVTDPDLTAPISVISLDGYFITFSTDGRFQISSVDEGTSWDALDFATAEANPDGGVRNAQRNRDAVFFGHRSTEFWQNTGGVDFPFSRVTTIDVGCHAASSVVELTLIQKSGPAIDTIIWAATNKGGAYAGVMMLQGYTPTKISTYEIDRLIEAETTPDVIEAFSWSENGHSFYAISGSTWTRVYDATEGFWHERVSYGLNRWRASCYAWFANTHVIGDYDDGILYAMSADTYDESGTEMITTIQTPPAHAFPYTLTWNEIILDVVKGVGLVTATDHLANPVLTLDYSDDGGKNFSGARDIEMGATAQVRGLLKRNRFGQTARGAARTWRIRCSAAVFRCFMSLSADVDKDAA